MEGIKCPICMAVSEMPGIKDGELIKCSYCKSKYTVMYNRRYNILPIVTKTNLLDITDCRQIEKSVKQLDYNMLLQLLKIVTDELVIRYRKRDLSEI